MTWEIFWGYVSQNGNAPLAVVCFVLCWVIVRLRGEWKVDRADIIKALKESDEEVKSEKDARREEALKLQSESSTAVSQVSAALQRIESIMVNCVRRQ